MQRLSAYSEATTDGGVIVDIEGMMVDLCTLLKGSGIPLPDILAHFSDIYNAIEVLMTIPTRQKN